MLGLLLTTQAAVSLFPETGGSVVNIGSRVSTVAPAGSAVSAASKAAVDAITKSLSKERGPRKIREGFISGGLADSPMEKDNVALTPLGRIGQPDDVGPQ